MNSSQKFLRLSYAPGMFIQVTKISKAKCPVTEPCLWEDWKSCGANDLSLPVDYCMRGVLMGRIVVGEQIRLLRTWRNGVDAVGYFYSTPISAILTETRVETFNSIYEVIPFAVQI